MTPVPTEAEEQRAVIEWAAALAHRFPCLVLLYASPQGELYRRAHGRPHVPGLKPGLPDLHLPVARRGFHGLWIEMKRQRGGKLSEAQKVWIALLTAEGHRVEVCPGADAAIGALWNYVAHGG